MERSAYSFLFKIIASVYFCLFLVPSVKAQIQKKQVKQMVRMKVGKTDSLRFKKAKEATNDEVHSNAIGPFKSVTFQLSFWEVLNDDGSGKYKVDEKHIAKALADINKAYYPYVQFTLKNFDTIRKTEYERSSPFSISSLVSYAKENDKFDADAINVYIYRFTRSAGIFSSGVVGVGKWTFTHDRFSKTFVHEIAHFFSLGHTHGAWNAVNCEHVTRNPADSLYNADKRGDDIADTHAVPNFVWEQRDYAVEAIRPVLEISTSEARDLVTHEEGFQDHPQVDTLEDALLVYGFTREEVVQIRNKGIKKFAYIDPETCSYLGEVRPNSAMFKDCKGTPYTVTEADIRNFMTNSLSDCMNTFTPGQLAHMKAFIEKTGVNRVVDAVVQVNP